MLHVSLLLAALCVLVQLATAVDFRELTALDPKYPIVFVHGVFGWGPDEMGPLKYWGGFHDSLQTELQNMGFKAFTVGIGPVASNWDRACELYAQIKGGVVDYGKNHAEKHNHLRYGRNFTGLYPEWGTPDQNGDIHKIHLVGHSMGGQTSRVLAQLLGKGGKGAPIEEIETSSYEDISELFTGGKADWIYSVSTISTPHDGATLADDLSEFEDFVKAAAVTAVNAAGVLGGWTNAIYDFKLDQWGVTPRKDGEGVWDYVNRVFKSGIFDPSVIDYAAYDLSTVGATELNKWVSAQPEIYYFSYSTYDTWLDDSWLTRTWHGHVIHKPYLFSMLLPMQPFGSFIGAIFEDSFTESWQKNDGVANTYGMDLPKLGSSDGKEDGQLSDDGISQVIRSGTWHIMGEYKMDHLTVVGMNPLKNPTSFYKSLAKFINSLEKSQQQVRHRRLSDGTSAQENYVTVSPKFINEFTSVLHEDIAKEDIKSIEELEERCSGENVSDIKKSACDSLIQNYKDESRKETILIGGVSAFGCMVLVIAGVFIHKRRKRHQRQRREEENLPETPVNSDFI